MKIPQYTSKSQFGGDSGARPLQAKVSPDQYGQLGELASRDAQSIVAGGQALVDIAVAELKQESATLLAGQSNIFQQKYSRLRRTC